MGVVLIINALSITQNTVLTKRIDFKTKTKASVISAALSGAVGIAMAFLGFGVWALVGQQITRQLTNTVCLWLFNKWWPNYAEELGNARNWLKQRTNYFLEYVRNYYKLDTLIPMTVNSDKESVDADIVFNGVKLTKGKFDGKYYKGRQVTLSGTPAGGQQVIGWTVVVVGSTTTTTEYSGATCTFEMPACTKVIVLAKLGAADGIDQQKLKSWTWRKAGNGLIVSNVPQGTRVALYDLQGIQLSAAEGNGSEITLPLAPQRAFVLKVGGESIKIKN